MSAGSARPPASSSCRGPGSCWSNKSGGRDLAVARNRRHVTAAGDDGSCLTWAVDSMPPSGAGGGSSSERDARGPTAGLGGACLLHPMRGCRVCWGPWDSPFPTGGPSMRTGVQRNASRRHVTCSPAGDPSVTPVRAVGSSLSMPPSGGAGTTTAVPGLGSRCSTPSIARQRFRNSTSRYETLGAGGVSGQSSSVRASATSALAPVRAGYRSTSYRARTRTHAVFCGLSYGSTAFSVEWSTMATRSRNRSARTCRARCARSRSTACAPRSWIRFGSCGASDHGRTIRLPNWTGRHPSGDRACRSISGTRRHED